jgi:hypothetical protein
VQIGLCEFSPTKEQRAAVPSTAAPGVVLRHILQAGLGCPDQKEISNQAPGSLRNIPTVGSARFFSSFFPPLVD